MSENSTLELVSMDKLNDMDTSLSKESGVKKYERPPMLPKGKDQVWPITARLIVNRLPAEAKHYHEVHDHQLEVGGKYINVPCYKAIGKKCPFCEAYWAARKNADGLKSKGAEAEGATQDLRVAYQKQQVIMQMMKQRQRYGWLVALPKDPIVYMFFAGPALTKAVFGDRDKKLPGAYQELKDGYKIPPYSLEEQAGWFLFGRTGQKLDTKYTAKPAVTEVIEGRIKTEKLMEEPLHKSVLDMCKANELPKLFAYFESRFWSLEEMENFIASQFTQVPERLAFLFKDSEEFAKPEGKKIETASYQLDEIETAPF